MNGKNSAVAVSINRSVVGKIPRDAPQKAWARFHSQWQPEAMNAHELAVNVWKGYSFAPVFKTRKIKADFSEAWHLALDYDCGDERAKFDNLLEDYVIKTYSSFLYYTPSSEPPAYKARVVFIFDKPYRTVEEYEKVIKAFAWRYPDSDQSTTDAARFFYGSLGAELRGQWSLLPQNIAAEVVDMHEKEAPTRAITPKRTLQTTAGRARATRPSQKNR